MDEIPVEDPFNVTADPALTTAAHALDPGCVEVEFRTLPWFGAMSGFELLGVRVTRYKPGRRCLIEYDLEVKHKGRAEQVVLVGKLRAKGADRRTFDLCQSLWQRGFNSSSKDGLCVPEPVGIIPGLRMWLQRKVPGKPLTRLLQTTDGAELAGRSAELIWKLHQVGLPASRRHTMEDELNIISERLQRVEQGKPGWKRRLRSLLDACRRLSRLVPQAEKTGIHRDFYPDQVVVEEERFYLLDLDLYCWGNPALDAGNFLAHVAEQALRQNSPKLLAAEESMKARFIQLSKGVSTSSIEIYKTLTLVRHIYLSTQFPDRLGTTDILLELCERRLKTPLRPWPEKSRSARM